MFVVVIRPYGADEASEVVGPFKTAFDAHDWITVNGCCVEEPGDDPSEWYEVFSVNTPIERGSRRDDGPERYERYIDELEQGQ